MCRKSQRAPPSRACDLRRTQVGRSGKQRTFLWAGPRKIKSQRVTESQSHRVTELTPTTDVSTMRQSPYSVDNRQQLPRSTSSCKAGEGKEGKSGLDWDCPLHLTSPYPLHPTSKKKKHGAVSLSSYLPALSVTTTFVKQCPPS